MLRWLLLPLGLVVAAIAAWLLLAPAEPPPVAAGDAPAPRPSASEPPAARGRAPEGATPDAPMGRIDDASRRELERVLDRELQDDAP
jgi:hypothetical protein